VNLYGVAGFIDHDARGRDAPGRLLCRSGPTCQQSDARVNLACVCGIEYDVANTPVGRNSDEAGLGHHEQKGRSGVFETLRALAEMWRGCFEPTAAMQFVKLVR
jgi:hypothetical protein